MKRSLAVLVVVLTLAFPAAAQITITPQVWSTLLDSSQQSPTTTVTMPVGTIYRIGSNLNNTWSDSLVSDGTPVVNFADGKPGHPDDSDPGVNKEFDILELSTTQTVTVSSNGTPGTKTIPAFVTSTPIPAPPATPTAGSNVWWSICSNCAVTLQTESGGPLTLKLGSGTPFVYTEPVTFAGSIYVEQDVQTYTFTWTSDGLTKYTTTVSPAGLFTTVHSACIAIPLGAYQTTICGPTQQPIAPAQAANQSGEGLSAMRSDVSYYAGFGSGESKTLVLLPTAVP